MEEKYQKKIFLNKAKIINKKIIKKQKKILMMKRMKERIILVQIMN
jgi:hypothetical protein